jgi:methylmalonyl-CoA mutase cobalamin-binding subunit
MTSMAGGSYLPHDLPDGRALLDEGRRLGDSVTMGVSLLCETHGVRSEVEYKRKMVAEGRIMTSMNIGMQTWSETARALEKIWQACDERGFRIDRYQMQVDRRMGLPPELWDKAAKETGPMLETPSDWRATAHTVPIQPHLGDMMIGSPMSVSNARNALEAGVNYIGNMSQFNWKYPGWPGDDVEQMAEMVKALGLMAAKRDDDAMFQSYLEDGFCAQFKDYCSYIGWALFERYLVDEVVGSSLSIAYGGLSHNPVTKAAMVLALEAIKPEATVNSFYHCNTTVYSTEIDENFAVLSIDDLYLMLAQQRSQSGAAILSIAVTEALRVPSWEEIVQVQTVARRIANDCGRLMESFNWPHIEALSERMVEGGRRFHANIMQGLDDLGVDMGDPMQILLTIRRMGGAAIENRWGIGELPVDDTALYQPVIPTDTYLDFVERRTAVKSVFASADIGGKENDVRLVVGSTDIHEYAMFLIVEGLQAMGIEPVLAGTSVDPDEFADLALEAGANAILVSTHNGMALTYAKHLQREVAERKLDIPIAMGGTLNQDIEGEPTPVDVKDDLAALGIHVCTDVGDLLAVLEIAG